MYRIMMMVLRLFFKVPYYFFKLDWMGKSEKYTEAECYQFIRKVTKKANKAGRVRIKAYGVERIPAENGFIFFPNHQGFYDVLAILDTCPSPFRIVMKKEAGHIILIKQVIRALNGLLIDRDDLRQSMKVINQMTADVKNGKNYLIFAEGTRTRNKNQLLEFKGGSFKSAVHAKCPIVPVALIDTYKPFDERSLGKVTVQIHYLKPIYYEEYQGMKTKEIAETVKQRIGAVIREFENSEKFSNID